jgi:8-oxo-dGTP pyrophosphatase MutT (NUDIX family)
MRTNPRQLSGDPSPRSSRRGKRVRALRAEPYSGRTLIRRRGCCAYSWSPIASMHRAAGVAMHRLLGSSPRREREGWLANSCSISTTTPVKSVPGLLLSCAMTMRRRCSSSESEPESGSCLRAEAALRELREEAGATGELAAVGELGSVEYPLGAGHERRLKRVRYYLVPSLDMPTLGKPPAGTLERRWLCRAELDGLPLVNEELRAILRSALDREGAND